MPLVDINAALSRTAVTWADLRWIQDCWQGPMVVKGVLTGDDARRAVDAGAAAVSVSNHGGRQLDCVQASVRALPEVVAAVNGQAEVWMDGGVRRGSDIVKALCLGARAVLWTRICLWPGSCGRSGSGARDRNSTSRFGAYAEVAGMPVHRGSGSYVHQPGSLTYKGIHISVAIQSWLE